MPKDLFDRSPELARRFQHPRHGGALRAAAQAYDIPLAHWLDLSTGINPTPYPLPPIAQADLARLPDPEANDALLAAARRCYGVGPGQAIVPVPGTDLALRILPLLAPVGIVDVVAPTYSGHGEAWRRAGRTVRDVAGLEAATAEIVIVANPNNPDGRTIDPDHLMAAARQLGRRDGLLVVDEAFADLAPDISVVPCLGDAPVVVLRSFGKFFGLAGLRLGFVIGHRPIVARLGELFGDWPVSGPALAAGIAALDDSDWQAKARLGLKADCDRLCGLLAGAGLSIAGRTDLFVLARSPAARDIHDALARQGIWTRIFAEDASVIRFGLPPADQFGRLEAALKTLER